MVVSESVVDPHDGEADQELQARCPAPRESTVPLMANLGEDPNSQCKVWFLLNVYCFCTMIRSKIVELNHHKSETVYLICGENGPRDTPMDSVTGMDWGTTLTPRQTRLLYRAQQQPENNVETRSCFPDSTVFSKPC